MMTHKLISADSHIVEPPDLYTTRIEPRFKDRAPRMERLETPTGRKYDSWFIDGQQAGTLGAVMQAGQRFEDPSQIDFLGMWEDVRLGAYDPQAMVKENEMDGVWGACLQPSQGLFWYRIPDSAMLSAICRVYNDWIAEFCKPFPTASRASPCSTWTTSRRPARSSSAARSSGWWARSSPSPRWPTGRIVIRSTSASGGRRRTSGIPLLLHIGTPRGGVPGCEFTMNLGELTGAGRSTTDYWVRYSLSAMIFAGVFDRYPKLKVGSVEHEASWIPHWLKQMDFTYRERPVFTKGWKSKDGLLPSDYWRRNMFVEFMEDDLGVQLRDLIGVDTMLWGSDFPHAESTWPKSRDFLDRMFAGVPEADLRKITSENAARMFGFSSTLSATSRFGAAAWRLRAGDPGVRAVAGDDDVGGRRPASACSSRTSTALSTRSGRLRSPAGAALDGGGSGGYVVECPLHYASSTCAPASC